MPNDDSFPVIPSQKEIPIVVFRIRGATHLDKIS